MCRFQNNMCIKVLCEGGLAESMWKYKTSAYGNTSINTFRVVSDLCRRRLALEKRTISYFSFCIFILTRTALVAQKCIFFPKKSLKWLQCFKKNNTFYSKRQSQLAAFNSNSVMRCACLWVFLPRCQKALHTFCLVPSQTGQAGQECDWRWNK